MARTSEQKLLDFVRGNKVHRPVTPTGIDGRLFKDVMKMKGKAFRRPGQRGPGFGQFGNIGF